jgi:predicted GNAT family acetyltransferase
MQILNKEVNNHGIFYIEIDGEKMAEMDYTLSTGRMTINHTEVDEKLKGKNVGYQLVHHAAEYARTNNLKIIPLCPFANAVFKKKHDEYSDVLLS